MTSLVQDQVGGLVASRGHGLSSLKRERKKEQVKSYSHTNEDSTSLTYVLVIFRSEQDKFSWRGKYSFHLSLVLKLKFRLQDGKIFIRESVERWAWTWFSSSTKDLFNRVAVCERWCRVLPDCKGMVLYSFSTDVNNLARCKAVRSGLKKKVIPLFWTTEYVMLLVQGLLLIF